MTNTAKAPKCKSSYTTKVIHVAATRPGRDGLWPACGSIRVDLPFVPVEADGPAVTCSKC